MEQLREVERPEGATRDEAEFVARRGGGAMRVFSQGSACVEDAFGRTCGAGGEEYDAGTVVWDGEGGIEGVVC